MFLPGQTKMLPFLSLLIGYAHVSRSLWNTSDIKYKICSLSNEINAINRAINFQIYSQQECIPVGCVPPAHWPYATRMAPAMHAPHHACHPCHTHSSAMYSLCHAHPRAMHAPPATPPAMHAPYHAPPRGQNSWHTLLKILPCPDFLAGSNGYVLVIYLAVNSHCIGWSKYTCT